MHLVLTHSFLLSVRRGRGQPPLHRQASAEGPAKSPQGRGFDSPRLGLCAGGWLCHCFDHVHRRPPQWAVLKSSALILFLLIILHVVLLLLDDDLIILVEKVCLDLPACPSRLFPPLDGAVTLAGSVPVFFGRGSKTTLPCIDAFDQVSWSDVVSKSPFILTPQRRY